MFNANELIVVSEQQPGTVILKNYDSLKSIIQKGVEFYNIEYSISDYDLAINNRDELKRVKKILEDKKKEIESAYTAPYKDVEQKLDELIALIKVPFKIADDFIKSNEKVIKEREIKAYAEEKAAVLGSHADKIINSESFFNTKWLNASCRAKQWQGDIDNIIRNAANDIQDIQSLAGKDTPAVIAHYYSTLSLERVKDFMDTLSKSREKNTVENEVTAIQDNDDNVVGYKVLKVYGTEQQMLQFFTQMDLMGIEYDELEDGMPKSMEEVTIPNFDSFVAFDIEHTGTYGAAHGDAEAEIIEIGAVKVVNGIIVDKFDELCNPRRKIVNRVAKLTNISDDMVKDKPSVSEIIKLFKEFVGDSVLIGHNIKGCDIPHITRAAKRAGIAFENKFLDTRILANKYKKQYGWENIKLTTLSEYFGISQSEAHRAWCDAEANAYVYLELKKLS